MPHATQRVTCATRVQDFDVICVGGGLAGLSAAWALARAGVARLCVLEREWACGTRASGTNAAIFRHFESRRSGATLAVRSRQLLDELGPRLLSQTGALYLGDEPRLAPGEAVLRALHVPHTRLTAADVCARYPLVCASTPGVFVPGDGVVDLHGVLASLQAKLRRSGAVIHTSADVVKLTRADTFTVTLATGAQLQSRELVLAGGAWSAGLARLLGLDLAMEPRRRHLAVLEPSVAVDAAHPVVWRLDEEVYFRPESGGVLASPCDETPWPAGEAPTEASALVALGERLERLSGALHESRVRRAWACLRTFAPDRDFVAGADPRLPGLHWLAGLGGRGVTCGLALGEVVAASVLGQPHPLLAELAPGRRHSLSPSA